MSLRSNPSWHETMSSAGKPQNAKLPSPERQRCNPTFLDGGGKRSATPLWKRRSWSQSGVAAAFCHRSPNTGATSHVVEFREAFGLRRVHRRFPELKSELSFA